MPRKEIAQPQHQPHRSFSSAKYSMASRNSLPSRHELDGFLSHRHTASCDRHDVDCGCGHEWCNADSDVVRDGYEGPQGSHHPSPTVCCIGHPHACASPQSCLISKRCDCEGECKDCDSRSPQHHHLSLGSPRQHPSSLAELPADAPQVKRVAPRVRTRQLRPEASSKGLSSIERFSRNVPSEAQSSKLMQGTFMPTLFTPIA